MKYQEINELLQGRTDPRLLKVIQYLHAENAGLKQEITGIARGLDRIIEMCNSLATVVGLHQAVMNGVADGKDMSQIISELRAEHLTDVVSEEVKQ